MSFGLFLSSTVVYFILGIFIAIAVDPEAESITPLALFFAFSSPALGPLLGWLLVGRPLAKRAHLRRKEEWKGQQDRVATAVRLHRPALVRNLKKAVKTNDYGVVTEDLSYGVWREFFESIGGDMGRHPEAWDLAKKVLLEIDAEERKHGVDLHKLPENGHQFEAWVASALEAYGWSTSVTRGSGDQGIDVIARRNGKSLGIQCKLHSRKIGNKAVQEAHAGQVHYRLDDAAVLSNADYTPSAASLATSTGVHLLSHFDIPTLHRKLEGYDE